MITAQSLNWSNRLTQRAGRGAILQAYLENLPDVLCTEVPADQRTKTYAVAFDGVDDYGDAGTSTALTNLADVTICAWIKVGALNRSQTIAGAFDSLALKGYKLNVGGSGEVVVVHGGAPGGAAAVHTMQTAAGASNLLTAGEWAFVAISVGGLTRTVIQGVVNDEDLVTQYGPATRATRGSFVSGAHFYIGAEAPGVFEFLGRVGYLAVFRRALTLREIRRVKYRFLTVAWGNNDNTGLWDVCVAQWDCERGAGSKLVNSRNRGTHDVTLVNGPTWVTDPAFTVVYRPVLSAAGSQIGQDLEPLGTKTSIQSATLKLLDTGEWFTAWLATVDAVVQQLDIRVFLGFFGLMESEYQIAFGGRVQSIDFQSKAYTLRLGDALLEAKVRQDLAKGSLLTPWTANYTRGIQVTSSAYYWDAVSTGIPGYLKIEDEVVRYTGDIGGGGGTFALDLPLGGGQFGTAAVDHAMGNKFTELWVIDGVHPLTIALQLLLSGSGFGAVSAYDTLVEFTWPSSLGTLGTRVSRGRGLGMSPSDVAVAEIEALRDNVFPGYQFRLFVKDTITDVKDLIEAQLLRPIGCYLAVKADGRLTIRSHKIPTSADVVATLDYDDGLKPTWELTDDNVVNILEFTFDYVPAIDGYKGELAAIDGISGKRFRVRKREYTFDGVSSLYSGVLILAELQADIFRRFATPYAACSFPSTLEWMVLDVGDTIKFTNLNLPDVLRGRRGIVLELFQIEGRRLDPKTGTVTLKLADVSRA